MGERPSQRKLLELETVLDSLQLGDFPGLHHVALHVMSPRKPFSLTKRADNPFIVSSTCPCRSLSGCLAFNFARGRGSTALNVDVWRGKLSALAL